MMVRVIGIIVLSAAAAQEAVISAAARRTIAETNAAWLEAMKRQDAAAIAAIYGEDAVFITAAGEALRGRTAIENFERERFNATGPVVEARLRTMVSLKLDSLSMNGATPHYASRGTTRI